MDHLMIELIKYTIIFLMVVYSGFSFLSHDRINEKKKKSTYAQMSALIFSIHLLGHIAIYLQVKEIRIIYLYILELVFFLALIWLYQYMYPDLSKFLLRNVIMLINIGFIIQLRLSIDGGERQFLMVAVSAILCLFIPKIIKSVDWIGDLGWLYGLLSIAILLLVLFFGKTYYGATNWLEIKGHVFQPSEFIKIIYLFFLASVFRKEVDLKKIVIVGFMASINVLILVLQKDLGGALIFYFSFIVILYIGSGKVRYFVGGVVGGAFASSIAYKMFGHVRIRFAAWQKPLALIDNEGYQISQSLFAIGTGGWLGMGVNKGLPKSIPVVESDFVFSAIAEEFGGIFALCLIVIYINIFLLMIRIALKKKEAFYKILALGLSTMLAFQVFLSIGGVIKLIPSTGVTLPLISYGGSSILATMVVVMVVQGIYIRPGQEGQGRVYEKN